MKIKSGVFSLCYASAILLTTPGWSAAPSTQSFHLAQSDSPFYTEPQSLSPEQLKIQKYKLQRLRIQDAHRDWFITRGVNQRVDEITLLKLTGQIERLSTRQINQSIGNSMTVGGLSLMAVGGVLLANLVKFDGSFWYGLSAFVAGGVLALVGEGWANNLSELDGHVMERLEAESLIKQYNDELKKEMGVEGISDL